MPSVSGLNHITLAVTDPDRSVAFYGDLLGFKLRARWPDGAYLEAGSLWLCLSRDEPARLRPHPDYTHLAFSVEPGIYLEGRYGARIEDIVVCGPDGPIRLNASSRELRVVSG